MIYPYWELCIQNFFSIVYFNFLKWSDIRPSMRSILGICAQHLTHPRCTHTQQWTHTRSSGHWQPFMLRCPGSSWGFSALLKGTSVVVLRVKRVLYIHSPHQQNLPAWDSNSQPFNYESDSLTIRPQLPLSVPTYQVPSSRTTFFLLR